MGIHDLRDLISSSLSPIDLEQVTLYFNELKFLISKKVTLNLTSP